jgi:DNA-binding transcriptional ArsR family regulator
MALPVAHFRASAALPVGYKGPRAAILVELKLSPGRTARDLGCRLGLSLNAIRHHLRELEVDGLVAYEREQRGVGAPVFAYRLSAAGEAVFPRCHDLPPRYYGTGRAEGREVVVRSRRGMPPCPDSAAHLAQAPVAERLRPSRGSGRRGSASTGRARRGRTLTEHNRPCGRWRRLEIRAAEERLRAALGAGRGPAARVLTAGLQRVRIPGSCAVPCCPGRRRPDAARES